MCEALVSATGYIAIPMSSLLNCTGSATAEKNNILFTFSLSLEGKVHARTEFLDLRSQFTFCLSVCLSGQIEGEGIHLNSVVYSVDGWLNTTR